MESPLSITPIPTTEEIKLDANNFFIVKDLDKFKLKIKTNILGQEKNFFIDLDENNKVNLSKEESNNYEKIIKQKDIVISEQSELIKLKNEKIKSLEEELNNIKKNSNEVTKTEVNEKSKDNDNAYADFNLRLRNPSHKLNVHTSYVYSLTMLNDGRLASGSFDNSIIVYNKSTYQPDLIIKEHNSDVYCVTTLSSGILASGSDDKSIKLFKIKGNDYEILQE